ncbi:peptidoglycan DD-transpeptidase MrdA [Photorhabdus laumondii subsp. laumondii]|uniref:Peptidoglycan D,D-transpeptidase MrdA n=2 Tax=Photorhabdus laumondii subsp. laumondii TaxID=141679 RepID=Q7N761_PHOLL|nr:MULTISPECIES: peptidoglycan DD-transpeptidase MrdA [Photorhabdus]AWK41177.1 penicillin-binding protein 2 [Photorhabdus laumondii subsp. laumondii]AXG41910.1 penicillin-binding protein 2 [Photorhabdus laumondii subsp. laumondii]AXG46497.1 penicillin-binding protein 2 [Photorhabdus laumondii subsp. laumondii]MCC8383903.1 peptidoglycan DD-transpeptidase MrdA [Photorhabdus laumondii]MCC8386662.1 peptidoglycan DD-transpeptidase MrdA [Photorhabdus laumondii]
MKNKRTPFRDYTAESALFARRALVAFIIILVLTGILMANLYHLQITRHEDYQTRSNENRIKLVPIAPSRGIIYDRNGTPLALNRTIYQLEIIPEKVEHLEQTLNDLRNVIDLTDEDIANFEKERKRSRRFTSIPLKTSLDHIQVARFAVNQYRFPGFEIKGYQRRFYPYGSALTHIIGYVAKINDKDVERLDKEGILPNYAATHDIGKLGIERYYETVLHGKTGYEEVEVNNRGRVIRQLHEQPPQAGQDIYLTIDLELQIYIEKLLTTSRAAVVVSDPRNGEILALVSNPSYDPNLFVNGISNKNYQELLNNPDRPLINRATQGIYPPASTVKPFITVAALSTGVINKNTTIFDPGWWQLPGSEKRYRDWKRWGHGSLNAHRAIVESADTFFYQVAYDMGIDRLSEWMTKFGYGEYTGIDLAEERTGIMPTREWKQRKYKKPWYQGDTIPVGIGQGYWTATPIQMVKALTTLINDGNVKTPHLLLSKKLKGEMIPYQQTENIQIGDIHSGYWELAKSGMYGVANLPNGTGHKSFISTPYKAAVKSGTAQVYSYETYNASKIAEHLRDHKLMTAFAPYENPTVALSIILENGGAGPAVGTLVRQILDHVLLGDNNITLPNAVPTPPGTESD